MKYESGFFENRRGRRLFFALEGERKPDTFLWIFIGPLLEEKIIAHSVLRNFSRSLTAEGYAVLRFDGEGEGDSEGDTTALGLCEWAHDAVDAANFARTMGFRNIGFFGCRLGAAVATLGAAEARIARLMLWFPIEDGAEHLQELLRYNLAAQLSAYQKVMVGREELLSKLTAGGSIHVMGWEIGKQFYESVSAFQLQSALDKLHFDEPAVILSNSDDIVGATRVNCRPFWHESRIADYKQDALTEASLNQLRRVRV